jgi:YcxB-like protein
MDRVSLTIKLGIEDYARASRYIFYRQPIGKMFTGFGIFLSMISLLLISDFTPTALLLYYSLSSIYLIIGLPVQTYLLAKKKYSRDSKIGETTQYDFDKEGFQLTKESLQSKWTWAQIRGVSEGKDWILIWENKQVAHAIPIKDFKAGQLEALKEIVNAQPGLKKKLRK